MLILKYPLITKAYNFMFSCLYYKDYQITDKTTTKATIAPTTMFTSPSTADTQLPITVTQKGNIQ